MKFAICLLISLVEVFKAMPDSIIPALSENNRLDMLDFRSSGMKAEVDNLFGEKSVMDTLSADTLGICLSDRIHVGMMLVPSPVATPDSTTHLVRVTTTYMGNPMEWKTDYYTSKWNAIKIDKNVK